MINSIGPCIQLNSMKVDPVVSNSDQLYLTNQSQQSKIVYLESCKSKQEAYIRDLQESLKFNKESISMLTLTLANPKDSQSDNTRQTLPNIVKRLNEENISLLQKTKKYYDELMSERYVVLIEQQLRAEEKKIYSERILDFQNNIDELRKYLQDKEESFSTVVSRLKKYQDISETPLETKLYKLSNELGEDYAGPLLKKIIDQRDKYKEIWEKINVGMEELSFLKSCFESKQSYESMISAYTKYRENCKQEKEKGISFCEPTKHTSGNNTTGNAFSKQGFQKGQSPNKELIKLLKKQKLNNDILQEALNEAIEKNEELIIQNNTLVSANIELHMKLEQISSKCALLENQLGEIHGWKKELRGTRFSEKGGDRIVQKQFEVRGDEHQQCLELLQADMEKLSTFIMTCVPKTNFRRSASNPNIRPRNEVEEQDIQIEEI